MLQGGAAAATRYHLARGGEFPDDNCKMDPVQLRLLISFSLLTLALTAHPAGSFTERRAHPNQPDLHLNISTSFYPTSRLGFPGGRAVHHVYGGARQQSRDDRTLLMGPSLIVTEGDLVHVQVHNHLLSEGTTLHHHGLHQHLTPFYDGVPGLSQSPISPGTTMTYSFLAHPAGTHYYHSHVGLQAASGVHGPLIVRSRSPDHWSGQFDEERVLFFSDLSSRYDDRTWLAGLIAGAFMSSDDPESDLPWHDTTLLLNGIEASNSTMNLDPGRRYRLRMINAAANWALGFEVQCHVLRIIATDGQNVQSRLVRRLIISPGERYDAILVPANLTSCGGTRFDIHISTRNGHMTSGGVFQYSYNPTAGPSSAAPVLETFDAGYMPTSLRANPATTPMMPNTVSKQLDLQLGGNMQSYRWTINGVTFNFDLPEPLALFSATGMWGSPSFHHVSQGSVVDLLVRNPTGMQHPFHLHGHKFWLAASDTLANLKSKAGDVASFIIAPEDRPLYKDSVTVATNHFVVLRVHFENPGPWLFHCHTNLHLAQGMATAIIVGDASEQPTPPCGVIPGLACSIPAETAADSRFRASSPWLYLIGTLIVFIGSIGAFVCMIRSMPKSSSRTLYGRCCCNAALTYHTISQDDAGQVEVEMSR